MGIGEMFGINPGAVAGGISSFLLYTLYGLIGVGIFGFILFFLHFKKTYKYPVRIFRRRDNGKIKETNVVGGFVSRHSGAPFFRIKLNMFKSIDLTETPKLQYMDEDDRVYYNQIDVNTFVQVKREFQTDLVRYTPVESDVKYGAILSVQRVRDVLNLEPTWKKVLPYLGLIIMAIVFIVAYSMLMDKCG